MIDRAPAIPSLPDDGLHINLTPDGQKLLAERLRQTEAELLATRRRLAELAKEPTNTITLRIPVSLHARLKDVSHENRTSMNGFCTAVLLDAVGGPTGED